MADPIKPTVAVGAVNQIVSTEIAKQATPLKAKVPTEFVVLIRHPEKKTLHALLNPKVGPGALAVFESPELASVQASTIPSLHNKEYYIIPVE